MAAVPKSRCGRRCSGQPGLGYVFPMAPPDHPEQQLPASSPARWGGRLVIVLLLGALLTLGYLVIRNFLVPLLWAAILAYLTWPLNERLRRWLKQRHGPAALLMTLVLTFAIVLPLLASIVALREELAQIFETLQELSEGQGQVPPWLADIPILGPRLSEMLGRMVADPDQLGDWLAESTSVWLGEAASLMGVLGRNAMKFALALIAVFFFYRDGESLVAELRRGLRALLGSQSRTYWDAAARVTQAVVYGLVLTALAQGALASVGYWGAGVDAPVLVGAITALFALVPFGAPLVWGSVSLWLLWHGSLWAGLGLLVWGMVIVSSVDNVIRPLVISASARISFLLVLFGVLGGLSAFGLVGLFLGPAVLSVLWAVWRHWIEQNDPGAMP